MNENQITLIKLIPTIQAIADEIGLFSTPRCHGKSEVERLSMQDLINSLETTSTLKGVTFNEYNVLNMTKVLMPESLTAENGAKAILSGEFYEKTMQPCAYCNASGYMGGQECDDCNGTGEYPSRCQVSWTTIKEIYAMAVKHLGQPAPLTPTHPEKKITYALKFPGLPDMIFETAIEARTFVRSHIVFEYSKAKGNESESFYYDGKVVAAIIPF